MSNRVKQLILFVYNKNTHSYLGQGVTAITGLFVSVLFVNDITAGGNRAVEQGLLNVLVFGGQQIAQHRHYLRVLNESHISITSKFHIALKKHIPHYQVNNGTTKN